MSSWWEVLIHLMPLFFQNLSLVCNCTFIFDGPVIIVVRVFSYIFHMVLFVYFWVIAFWIRFRAIKKRMRESYFFIPFLDNSYFFFCKSNCNVFYLLFIAPNMNSNDHLFSLFILPYGRASALSFRCSNFIF